MSKLQSKQNTWIEKLEGGDSKYLAIARTGNNAWHLISNRRAEPIKALNIIMDNDDGTGLRPYYSFLMGQDENTPCQKEFLIKDERKMIVSDGSSILYSFGIKGSEAVTPIKSMLIYVRTEQVHTFIFASRECNSIKMSYTLVEQNADAISLLMDGLGFPSPKMSNKEVNIIHE